MTTDTGHNRHDAIIDAFLKLLAEREFDRIQLADIAEQAEVSLAEFAAVFTSKLAILNAFTRRIDGEVLQADASDMATEAARERLFDVLMSRIDALRPYRAAIGSLMRSVRRDAGLAMALNALSLRSQVWMLAAAGIETGGWRGRVVAQGLSVSFARVLRVFVGEDDVGLPRTMAALDRELRQAERGHARTARWAGSFVRDRSAYTTAAAAAAVPFPAASEPPAKQQGDMMADVMADVTAEPGASNAETQADRDAASGVIGATFTAASVAVDADPATPEEPPTDDGPEASTVASTQIDSPTTPTGGPSIEDEAKLVP